MRRKNRKWVALGIFLYLGVMYSAFRWSVGLRRPGEDSLFLQKQREDVRRLQAEQAEQAKHAPQPTGELRLKSAGPSYVAVRYDDSHVVFIVTTDTESRFNSSPLMRSGNPTRVSVSTRPSAPLAGLQELWEPDTQSLHFFPKIIQDAKRGDQWSLNLSPTLTIPVSIDRAIVAPTGCNLALGFLADVPAEQQGRFATSPSDYFVVRRTPVEPADPQVQSQIAALPNWKLTPAARKQIEALLIARMKQEVSVIDASLRANAGTPGATANEMPIANPLPRLKEWLHADKALIAGEGTVDFDAHAYKLSPDGDPRLFVRSRWMLANTPVFLMAAWFREESSGTNKEGAPALPGIGKGGNAVGSAAGLKLLFADTSWSRMMREGEAHGSLGDRLDFATILNQFDADHDGWAELLIHSDEGESTAITLYLYTDQALVPMKMPLTRYTATADVCLDP